MTLRLGPGSRFFAFGLVIIAIGLILPHYARPNSAGVLGFLATCVGMLLLFAACGYAIAKKPFAILVTAQNTYSIARLQMVAWTWLILSGLIAVAVVRLWNDTNPGFALNIYISGNLLAVMGIAFFTGAAAPALMTVKTDAPTASQAQVQAAQAKLDGVTLSANGQLAVHSEPRWSNLIRGDDIANAGTVDISKVQQLLITALLIGIYFAMLWDMLASAHGIPPMSDSQYKMLADAGVSMCGPAQAPVATDPTKLDATKLKEAQAIFQAAKTTFDACRKSWTVLPDLSGQLLTLLAISHGGYLAYKAIPKASAAPDTKNGRSGRPGAG